MKSLKYFRQYKIKDLTMIYKLPENLDRQTDRQTDRIGLPFLDFRIM